MFWLIVALVVGSMTVIWMPQPSAVTKNIHPFLKLDAKVIKSLVTLSVAGIILCAVFTINQPSIKSFTAIFFMVTASFVAVPRLHRFILPCALTTAVLVIAMVAQ
ncbi:hypothetical protein JQC92_08845 [Shewanella sp. 202IG2-18]|uniref:hypothetical protein n=1 Tax=Parashewanella hymeniacidonis TaxID=2807618 RepID=UPI0019606039|nr:hypothetical protein [Parashewanella hymeniacidonis]MBM7072135.1 hypothetical protein [Parashewanella hymeniacidonis]